MKKYHVNSIAPKSVWQEGEATEEYRPFQKIGFYEGEPHVVDASQFCEETGIYHGEPHHALVWPEQDTDADWKRCLTFDVEDIRSSVEVEFTARGPRVAFCGHSFTGLWDSAYYYFRELAKMGGWNAQIAYSYWGGTGISKYAGLTEESELQAEQCRRLIAGNEYYDFITLSGNSDEAVQTCSGKEGATDYMQRAVMLQGAKMIFDRVAGRGTRMILWPPHAYQYGFLQDMCVKPWRKGQVGDAFEKDGRHYTLTLTSEMMTRANSEWYASMALELGDNALVLRCAWRIIRYTPPTERVWIPI